MKKANVYVPVSEKYALTLNEASSYFNIGINRLRTVADNNNSLVLWVGGKRLIKRCKMENYLNNLYELQ